MEYDDALPSGPPTLSYGHINPPCTAGSSQMTRSSSGQGYKSLCPCLPIYDYKSGVNCRVHASHDLKREKSSFLKFLILYHHVSSEDHSRGNRFLKKHNLRKWVDKQLLKAPFDCQIWCYVYILVKYLRFLYIWLPGCIWLRCLPIWYVSDCTHDSLRWRQFIISYYCLWTCSPTLTCVDIEAALRWVSLYKKKSNDRSSECCRMICEETRRSSHQSLSYINYRWSCNKTKPILSALYTLF